MIEPTTCTERYYHRQCESAYARKPVDLDLDDMNPFIGNDSYLAEKMWNDCMERHGHVKRRYPGKETRCNISAAERQAVIDHIKRRGLTQAQFAEMCDLARPTIGILMRGGPVSQYTMDRVRLVMGKVNNDC